MNFQHGLLFHQNDGTSFSILLLLALKLSVFRPMFRMPPVTKRWFCLIAEHPIRECTYQWYRRLLMGVVCCRYCPVDVAQAIYGNVNGAKYDTSTGFWSVPCDAEIDMALQFGSVR